MPDIGQIVLLTLLVLLAIFIIVAIARAVRIVPQAVALIIERLGKFQVVLYAGLHLLIPFVDKVRAGVDLREQVVSFAPQPVITSDNLVVSIDTVIYFQVTDPKSATYEIANYITGIEQLTVTTLRNVIGSMDLEQTLTSRDQINGQLRGVLDEATTKWGIRVNRVELKAIDPPASVQGAMEQQMKAERDRRAAILTAEGVKQSQILTAEGEKQSAILRAEGQAQAAILRAQGESRAILQVFDAIHRGNADPKLLAYTYLQTLPKIADGQSSKLWVIPAEFTAALNSITGALGGGRPGGVDDDETVGPVDFGDDDGGVVDSLATTRLLDPNEALRRAQAEASRATDDASEAGEGSGRPFNRSVEAGQAPSGIPAEPAEAPRHDTHVPVRPEDGPGGGQAAGDGGQGGPAGGRHGAANPYAPPAQGTHRNPVIIPIESASDPRVADYFHLTDVALRRKLEAETGLYIAESSNVIRRAIAAGHRPESFLMEERWLESMEDVLEAAGEAVPVYVAPEDVLSGITGFHLHRGAIASMNRPPLRTVEEVLAGARDGAGARRVLVLEDIVDHTNVGAAIRSAAALGVDAVLVTPRCSDPLYRRAVRVSMGTVFQIPWTRIDPWPGGIDELRRLGFTVAALALAEDAVSLDDLAEDPPARLAFVLGTEGDGLSRRTVAAADLVVRIPMEHGVDSLNVAAAGAVAFWATRVREPDSRG